MRNITNILKLAFLCLALNACENTPPSEPLADETEGEGSPGANGADSLPNSGIVDQSNGITISDGASTFTFSAGSFINSTEVYTRRADALEAGFVVVGDATEVGIEGNESKELQKPIRITLLIPADALGGLNQSDIIILFRMNPDGTAEDRGYVPNSQITINVDDDGDLSLSFSYRQNQPLSSIIFAAFSGTVPDGYGEPAPPVEDQNNNSGSEPNSIEFAFHTNGDGYSYTYAYLDPVTLTYSEIPLGGTNAEFAYIQMHDTGSVFNNYLTDGETYVQFANGAKVSENLTSVSHHTNNTFFYDNKLWRLYAQTPYMRLDEIVDSATSTNQLQHVPPLYHR